MIYIMSVVCQEGCPEAEVVPFKDKENCIEYGYKRFESNLMSMEENDDLDDSYEIPSSYEEFKETLERQGFVCIQGYDFHINFELTEIEIR